MTLRRRTNPTVVLLLTLALLLPSGPAAAAVPGNDDLDNARVIASLPFTDTADTTEATPEESDPDCRGNGPTVWYAYTPTADGVVVADTSGSDYDTTLSAYSAGPDGLEQLACNDDFDGLQSRIRVELTAGRTYHFMVGSYGSGAGGSLRFEIDHAPPPHDINVGSVTATVRPDGGVDLRGTVTCSTSAYVNVDGTLQQARGRLVARSYFSTGVWCEAAGPATPWEAVAPAHEVVFTGGPARLDLAAHSCDGFTCDGESIRSTLRVRGR